MPCQYKIDGDRSVGHDKPRHSGFKKDIKPMDNVSEALYALQPVTFHYKREIDVHERPKFGLDCRRGREGEPRSSRAGREWRNLHRALRPGERDVAQRVPKKAPHSGELGSESTLRHNRNYSPRSNQKQIEALTAGPEKVSAQLAAASPSVADLKRANSHRTNPRCGPAPHVVNNP